MVGHEHKEETTLWSSWDDTESWFVTQYNRRRVYASQSVEEPVSPRRARISNYWRKKEIRECVGMRDWDEEVNYPSVTSCKLTAAEPKETQEEYIGLLTHTHKEIGIEASKNVCPRGSFIVQMSHGDDN